MENSVPSLITGDGTSRVTESLLSPSSAHLHLPSDSSHQSHPVASPWDRELHPKQRLHQRSSLIDALRQRFPDGPPAVYDQFISVSLNDVPPNEMLAINPRVTRDGTAGVSPLKRIASKVWATVVGGMNSRPSLPLYNPRPTISHPRPIRRGSIRAPRLSPSPVQMYTDNFIGIGPPPPLPSPTDVLDIRPPSRNAVTASDYSHSQPACENPRYKALTEAMGSTLAPPARPDVARIPSKNSIVFPTHNINQKNIRILTPHASAPAAIPHTEAAVQVTPRRSRHPSFLADIVAYVSRIMQFRDPAESIFVLGFISGPQTWLIGGWYIATIDKREKKSNLRIWVDKYVEKTGDGTRHGSLEQAEMLLERIERASSGLTSESFEVGKRTATNSNASRAMLDAVPLQGVDLPLSQENPVEVGKDEHQQLPLAPLKHQRSSRAVWAGSSHPAKGHPAAETHYLSDDEISVDFSPIMVLFITALVTVCRD